MEENNILEKIDLVSSKIARSNIINKTEALKIVEYYNSRFLQCLDKWWFEKLNNQIDEYLNKWFLLQEEYNLKAKERINEVKLILSNSMLKEELNWVLNEIDSIVELHSIWDKKFYSISFLLEHIEWYLWYIQNEIGLYSESELEVKEDKDNTNNKLEINKWKDGKKLLVEELIIEKNNEEELVDDRAIVNEGDVDNNTKIQDEEKINLDSIKWDNDLESLEKKQKLCDIDGSDNKKILSYIKQKILYLRKNFNNLFFYKIKLLSIIKNTKDNCDNKNISINSEETNSKFIKTRFYLRDNIDSIASVIWGLNDQESGTDIILSLDKKNYLGVNSFSLLKKKWGIDENYVVV